MSPHPLRSQVATAVRRLLRPVVHQLIKYGVSFPALSRIVKEVYLEVAEQDFALPFKRQTDSRLALLTGLRRREVALLRRSVGVAESPTEVEDTVVTHVIGRWLAGPPYASPEGLPRQLRYDSDDPGSATFAQLVRELGVDLPARAVLDEMVRLGSAELLSSGDVVLRREAHIPTTGAEGKLTLLGSDPAEVFAAIVHNIEYADTPWLQRKVVYDNIGADALPELRAEARRLGEEFMRRANVLFSSRDRDRNPNAAGGARSRVVLGGYYFEESQLPGPRPRRGGPPALPGRIRRSK